MHATQIFWKKQLKNSYKTPFPQERVGIFPLGNRATQTWKKPLPITNFTTSKILPTSLCAKKNNFGARLKPVKNPYKSIKIHPTNQKKVNQQSQKFPKNACYTNLLEKTIKKLLQNPFPLGKSWNISLRKQSHSNLEKTLKSIAAQPKLRQNIPNHPTNSKTLGKTITN